MVSVPKTWPVNLSVEEAITALSDPKVHLLLLVREGYLDTTVNRGDLVNARGHELASQYGTTAGRTVVPTVPLAEASDLMMQSGARRLAVVVEDGTLVGLLCLKASSRGFCSDADVQARTSVS